MSGKIVVGKSAQEYFRELVSEALSLRGIQVREVTEFYLVDLLAQHLVKERLFAGSDEVGQLEPLAFILKRALEGDRATRWKNLKRLGDTSLFMSGFFGDAIARSLVDLDYYIAMGEGAYEALSGEPRGPVGAQELFGELAARFPEFVDLFAEIAELSELRSNRGLLRLYERFLLTGSERLARQLREHGVALAPGAWRPKVRHQRN